MKKRTATPGRAITVKHAVPSYYSGYAGRPSCIFKPGMVAIVHCITLKVCVVGEGPVHDRKQEFIVADFVHPDTGAMERVGIDFCNAKAIRGVSHIIAKV